MKLSALDSSVRGMLAGNGLLKKAFKRQDVCTVLQNLQSDHLAVLKSLSAFDGGKLGEAVAKLVMADQKQFPLYIGFKQQLNNRWRTAETSNVLISLLEANRVFSELLMNLERDVNVLFQQDRISVMNMRLSHVVISGVMHQSEELCTYTKFMLSYISNLICDLDAFPSYRWDYLTEHTESVVVTINTACEGTGAADFKSIIKRLQATASDKPLVSSETGDSNIPDIEQTLEVGKDSETVITAGILGLPSFRSIGEIINLIKHEFAKKLQLEENWMRRHVAVLQNRLDTLKPDEDEYSKLSKTISRYESDIDRMYRIRQKMG